MAAAVKPKKQSLASKLNAAKALVDKEASAAAQPIPIPANKALVATKTRKVILKKRRARRVLTDIERERQRLLGASVDQDIFLAANSLSERLDRPMWDLCEEAWKDLFEKHNEPILKT